MKLRYLVLLLVIIQLTKGKKGQKDVNVQSQFATANEEDLTDPEDIVPETVDQVGDNPTDTDILSETNLEEFAREGSIPEDDPLREIDTLNEDPTPVKEVIQDDADVLQSDDQSFVKKPPILYVKRVGESLGEETYIPVQDLVKSDLNLDPETIQADGNSATSLAPDVISPKETYYIRQDGTNPGEYIYIPAPELVGTHKMNVEDDNSNLGTDILNKTDILYGPDAIPVRDWDVDNSTNPKTGVANDGGGGGKGGGGGRSFVPLPYYMSNIRGGKSEGLVVLDDAEDIPKPVPYEPVYMERRVFKGQENTITLNDTELKDLSDKEVEKVPIVRPTMYVDGALRATGGGIQEEADPGDIRLFVKQNEYPELLPTMRVPAHSYPNLTATESSNVEGNNAAIIPEKIYSKTSVLPLKPVTEDSVAGNKEMRTTSILSKQLSGPTSLPDSVNVDPKAPSPVKPSTTSTTLTRPAANPVAKTPSVKPVPTPSTLPVKNSTAVKTVSTTTTTVTKVSPKKTETEVTVITKTITPADKTTPKTKSDSGKAKSPVTQVPVTKSTPEKLPATVKPLSKVPNKGKAAPKEPVTTTGKKAAAKQAAVLSTTTAKTPTGVKNAVKTATTNATATTAGKPSPIKPPTAVKPALKAKNAVKTSPTIKAPATKSVTTSTTRPTTKAPTVKSVPTSTARTTTKAPTVKSVPTSTARPTTKAPAVKSSVTTSTARPTTKAPIVKSTVTKTPLT